MIIHDVNHIALPCLCGFRSAGDMHAPWMCDFARWHVRGVQLFGFHPLFSFSFMSLRELWAKAAGERLGVCMCAGVGDLGWRWKWKKERAEGGVGDNV